ncbi:MAG: hypothetical protein ABSF89_15140 [Acidimicrobiales bacterium]
MTSTYSANPPSIVSPAIFLLEPRFSCAVRQDEQLPQQDYSG